MGRGWLNSAALPQCSQSCQSFYSQRTHLAWEFSRSTGSPDGSLALDDNGLCIVCQHSDAVGLEAMWISPKSFHIRFLRPWHFSTHKSTYATAVFSYGLYTTFRITSRSAFQYCSKPPHCRYECRHSIIQFELFVRP